MASQEIMMQNARDEGWYRCLCTGFPPWVSCCAVFVLSSLVTVAALGCGSIAFKTGGTAGDYQTAADRCRKEGRGESPAFERCMDDQGWVAKRLGAPAAASAPAENPSPRSPAGPAAASAAKANAPVENPSPRSPAAPAAPSAAKENVAAESQPPGSEPAPAAGDVVPSPQRSAPPSAEPPIGVKNWFKFGGTADELAAAKARCATKVGATDRPDPEADVFTGAMLDCLRDEGWRAF
jgi:hypothetical protein